MQIDLEVKYHDDDLHADNTIAEIPGTDLKDEIVMLGGHTDPWPAGTVTGHNGVGVAACMEAVRIIEAAGLASAPHHPHRPLDRGRRGPPWVQGLCDPTFRIEAGRTRRTRSRGFAAAGEHAAGGAAWGCRGPSPRTNWPPPPTTCPPKLGLLSET